MEMKFGHYLVRKEKEQFFAIYNTLYSTTLLTHKRTWRQATKTAKLLDEAYKLGYSESRDMYYEDAWRTNI